MTISSGILRTGDLPVFDPLPADYRKDPAPLYRAPDGSVAVGPPNLSAWGVSDGMLKALSVCAIDEQCATCNVCSNYRCTAGKCVITDDLGSGVEDCDDGLYCNGDELCVDEVGGPMCQLATPGDQPELTCSDAGQVCDEGTDACINPCADDPACDDLDDCTRDSCNLGTGLCEYVNICLAGRCCTGAHPDPKVCQAITLPECEAKDGTFLAMNNACEVLLPSGNVNNCPKYGSGIAPQGVFIHEVGPISDLDCEPLHEVGDDYETQNHADDPYMRISFLRFGGLVLDRPVNGARWQIAFHDQNGIKIEDIFWPDGTNDLSGSGIRTVDFDPPLTIPTKGYVVWSVMSNFGLDARVKLLSTDCPADKGENACTSMWVNGAVVDLLGTCSGGDRNGEQCDRREGNLDCTGGGTCEDAPDVIAFEIIGTKTNDPTQACCDHVTGECSLKLPWICTDGGDFAQGEGTLCGICEDGETPCDEPGDCAVECLPLSACTTAACCNNNTGECREVADTALCDDGNTETVKGFGTDCDPNCCELPVSLYDDFDNCSMGPVRVIQVPLLGDPPITINITGDNSAATFDDFPDICNSSIFDPDGVNKDPGWWEGFTLTACAEIRIDLCCTDINGHALMPQWSALVRDENDGGICCDTFLGNVGVDPPIGLGRDTGGWARGAPFCDEDNLWSTWGPLPAGKYYKMIYSAPDGTAASPPGAQYQMHITVGACPIAACCVGDDCSVINENECNQAGGYWHLGVIDCGTQPICTDPGADGLCCTGACCLGPGDCTDQTPGGEPMDEALCLAEPGEPQYIGGVSCADEPCPVCAPDSDENCHAWDSNWYWPIDRINGGLYAMAEDFVPIGSEVRQICWWGMYAIAETFLAECPAGTIPTEDFFEIRFYEDAGGVPGLELPDSPGPVVITAQQDMDTTEPISIQYSVKFDTPIQVSAGLTYWVSISGAGDPGGECQWWHATSYSGNGYSLIEGDPDMVEWTVEDRTGYLIDFAICLDTGAGGLGFDPPDPPTGACCECSGTCTNDVVWHDCSGGYDVDTDALIGAFIGQWEPGDTCARAVACSGGPPPGDNCTDPLVVSGDVVSELISTWCSTTDGLFTGTSCDNDNDEGGLWTYGIENDIWIQYTTTFAGLEGKLEFDLCADADWDVVFEVYSNGTATCPTCPPDPALRVPNFFSDDALCTDFECAGDPSFRGFVGPNECYLIRIGGERFIDLPELDPVGRGRFDLTSEETVCPETLAPLEDANTPDQGFGTKNRYASFDPTQLSPPASAGRVDTHAVRVKFVTVPGFEYAEGRTAWVQEPFEVTEASCCNTPTPQPTYWAAELGCSPYYTDWSGYGVVDVYDGGIIPSGSYDFQAINFIDCNLAVEANYSPALTVVMSAAGDLAGTSCAPTCNSPQGIVDFVDISADVEKFRNLPAAPRKARADMINSDVSRPKPDGKVDFVDISYTVDAFRAQARPPVGPPVDDPCE